MNTQQIYILMAVVVLLIILGLKIFLLKKKNLKPNISPLTGLAVAFLIGGIAFGEDRMISYGLTGIGALLAIIDLVKKLRKKPTTIEK